MDRSGLHSLRVRLLVPLLAVSVVAALVVAMASYSLGSHWATQEFEKRFLGMRQSLSRASFPLNDSVVGSLAELTQADLVTLGTDGQVLASTLQNTQSRRLADLALQAGPSQLGVLFPIGDQHFLAFAFERTAAERNTDRVETVLILFDERDLRAARWRAAVLPLATGLSTIVLIGTVALALTGRLVRRLSVLQRQVGLVAAGDFKSTISDDGSDEVSRLGQAVDSMARQLDQLWQAVHRQQSEKLLHQISGGMAHQLRNSLTGARMAIELHAKHCQAGDDEGLRVALSELEQLEDYVRRLLLVGSGQQVQGRAEEVLSCLHDVQLRLNPVARHLKVGIHWQLEESLKGYQVKDGGTLSAAATNLIINATQAGTQVTVTAQLTGKHELQLTVADDGPGPSAKLAGEIFEPFVTSKPEGLGLGLPLVRRAADFLNGEVRFHREGQQTLFVFTARLQRQGTP
ncbi:sensor histidine kinase [Aureliella helgolandensis]|uniref:Signal transduction histidine-protein kinase/phosphatase MprB n=1 Tax=Aureliella helgolandensis TaxID=2527968 RepID=A0A518GCI9_9BACT|nr:HAMP domain-containing sensor histidine kinase [Aureliella helgolandensis]QDV26267.1 Sporulation kinase A [Aureliella helgolandensis]